MILKGYLSKRLVVPNYPIDTWTGNCENACMFLREKSRTIIKQYEKFQHTWFRDLGIPTEDMWKRCAHEGLIIWLTLPGCI
ncbi:MAG: hypothetical protein AYP45_01130 [Candidatus Brocadia carolinensis]|uniref:Uncharacterized protein n=1 Tax=Candidatus Brocadia carolinensis TaxID=1004156 RepID=A0A1V4AXP2_9BACT|nr:MAG: hypothetical protein AYP45_01130 [Candidatus Brocadia caroliniensis]